MSNSPPIFSTASRAEPSSTCPWFPSRRAVTIRGSAVFTTSESSEGRSSRFGVRAPASSRRHAHAFRSRCRAPELNSGNESEPARIFQATYLCSLPVGLCSLLIVPVVATGLETCATSKKDDAAKRSRPSGGVTDLALSSLLPSLESHPSTFTSSPTFNTDLDAFPPGSDAETGR